MKIVVKLFLYRQKHFTLFLFHTHILYFPFQVVFFLTFLYFLRNNDDIFHTKLFLTHKHFSSTTTFENFVSTTTSATTYFFMTCDLLSTILLKTVSLLSSENSGSWHLWFLKLYVTTTLRSSELYKIVFYVFCMFLAASYYDNQCRWWLLGGRPDARAGLAICGCLCHRCVSEKTIEKTKRLKKTHYVNTIKTMKNSTKNVLIALRHVERGQRLETNEPEHLTFLFW